MLENFFHYIIIFTIYSFLGWLVEVIFVFITYYNRFYNRGFLYGPFLPIYGFGALASLIISEVGNFNSPLIIFSVGALVSTIIEYFTHLIIEKSFNLKLWDYSSSRFNLHGRISLENIILFGLGVLGVIVFIQPVLNNLIAKIHPTIIIITGVILLAALIVDLIATLISLGKIKKIQQEYPELRSELKNIRKAVDAKFAEEAHEMVDNLQNIPEALIGRITKLNNNTRRLLFRVVKDKSKTD